MGWCQWSNLIPTVGQSAEVISCYCFDRWVDPRSSLQMKIKKNKPEFLWEKWIILDFWCLIFKKQIFASPPLNISRSVRALDKSRPKIWSQNTMNNGLICSSIEKKCHLTLRTSCIINELSSLLLVCLCTHKSNDLISIRKCQTVGLPQHHL